MKIDIEKENKTITIILNGKLDTNTSPLLETKFSELEDYDKIIVDLKAVDYISSAGLRVLLSMQKEMNKKGEMTIKNVCSNVMDIFEVTGFSEILNIDSNE